MAHLVSFEGDCDLNHLFYCPLWPYCVVEVPADRTL